MIELTDYTSEDALLLAVGEIITEDKELIELLTRLRKTFDQNFQGEN